MKFCVDDLVEQGLVKKKTYTEGEFEGISVLKYSKKVFYNNLWNKDKRLLDCRGIVVDSEDNIIVWPFTKVFNLYENNTKVSRDKIVIAPRKINGFMCAISIYNGKPIYSTTGSLDSEFVKMAKSMIEDQMLSEFELEENFTCIFEICHPEDPHIVKEDVGVYLIGIRDHSTGKMMHEKELDSVAEVGGFYRPEVQIAQFDYILSVSKTCEHEGFMIIDYENGETLCKLKSNHYLQLKFFSRISNKKLENIFYPSFKKSVEEEYYPLQNYIMGRFSKEDWKLLSEQDRLTICREFFN